MKNINKNKVWAKARWVWVLIKPDLKVGESEDYPVAGYKLKDESLQPACWLLSKPYEERFSSNLYFPGLQVGVKANHLFPDFSPKKDVP